MTMTSLPLDQNFTAGPVLRKSKFLPRKRGRYDDVAQNRIHDKDVAYVLYRFKAELSPFSPIALATKLYKLTHLIKPDASAKEALRQSTESLASA